MKFKSGTYALLVYAPCFAQLGLVLEQLKADGTLATAFMRSLLQVRAEISRGADVVDLVKLGNRLRDYSITLHGYRTVLRVNEEHFTIMLMDIDDV